MRLLHSASFISICTSNSVCLPFNVGFPHFVAAIVVRTVLIIKLDHGK